MKENRRKSKSWKWVIQGLPIAAAAGSALLPQQRLGQQFTMLIILLWVQVFFIIECFVIGK